MTYKNESHFGSVYVFRIFGNSFRWFITMYYFLCPIFLDTTTYLKIRRLLSTLPLEKTNQFEAPKWRTKLFFFMNETLMKNSWGVPIIGYLIFLYFLVTLCRASVVHYCLLENECTRYLHFVPITHILLLFSYLVSFRAQTTDAQWSLFSLKSQTKN